MERRDFLKLSALASASAYIPNVMSASNPFLQQAASAGKAVVVIQLSGGNDGLNMIVPYRNDIYYKVRPRLAVGKNEVIRLTDEVGLNPKMTQLQSLYDRGMVSIINGVGYPDPNKSHFRSMEIWHTASDSNQVLQTGWIGRFLDEQCNTCAFPYTAIELDDAMSMVMRGEVKSGLASTDPKKLVELTKHPFFQHIVKASDEHHHHHPQVEFLRETLVQTSSSIDYLAEKQAKGTNNELYDSKLGKQLKTAARLINGGSETKLYYLRHGSFDTHANQRGGHDRLLEQLSNGIGTFMSDIQKGGRSEDVMVMVFSEFGRRVKQNGAGGTDHGKANNVLLIGKGVKNAGIYNKMSSLTDLDDGDLKYHVDFRSVYKTVLENWLHVPSEGILKKDFTDLGIL